MTRRDEQNKKLFIETLQFLIRKRNIALFQLNDCRLKGTPSQINIAEHVVKNLRLRFTLEVSMNHHLLTEAEKRNFYHDRRQRRDDGK